MTVKWYGVSYGATAEPPGLNTAMVLCSPGSDMEKSTSVDAWVSVLRIDDDGSKHQLLPVVRCQDHEELSMYFSISGVIVNVYDRQSARNRRYSLRSDMVDDALDLVFQALVNLAEQIAPTPGAREDPCDVVPDSCILHVTTV